MNLILHHEIWPLTGIHHTGKCGIDLHSVYQLLLINEGEQEYRVFKLCFNNKYTYSATKRNEKSVLIFVGKITCVEEKG